MWAVLLQVVLCACSLPALAQPIAAVAYTPSHTSCPTNFTLVRQAGTQQQSLSAGESSYLSTRAEQVLPGAWQSFLSSVEGTDGTKQVGLPSYVSQILGGQNGSSSYPTVGIAISGGGYRSAIFGAGILNALDSRNASSVAIGTGGLLQAATYLTGLSGGGWFLGSFVQADFPTIQELIFGVPNSTVDEGWLAQFGIVEPSSDPIVDLAYILELVQEVKGKAQQGFPITLTDIWARALARHFVNGTTSANFFKETSTHGAGVTLSSLAQLPTLVNHVQPFPIIISDSVSPFENKSEIFDPSGGDAALTNPIYEFNIFEVGSFDPMLSAFIPTEYLGSTNSTTCVVNYDQLAFIQGLSSSLFNVDNQTATTFNLSSITSILPLIEGLAPTDRVEFDAGALPNPFFGVAPSTFIDSNQTVLTLVDGGEDGETIPIQPLLVKARGVDVIVVVDAAADTEDNYTNGTSVIATQDRVALFPETYSFPPVPSTPSGFLSANLTSRPAFFGCNSSSSSSDALVIYLANGAAPLGQAPLTNTSTSQLSFEEPQIQAMLAQTFDIATQGIPSGDSKDPEWPACLACAVVDRSRRDLGIARSGVCSSCFSRYCWS